MYYIGLDVHKKTISYCVKDNRHVAFSMNPSTTFIRLALLH